jgi:hypothetical protein
MAGMKPHSFTMIDIQNYCLLQDISFNTPKDEDRNPIALNLTTDPFLIKSY